MKFAGKIGFYEGTKETKKNVHTPSILERPYVGDVLTSNRRFQPGEGQNDDITTNNRISILSDLYFQQNWTSIRYVLWNGEKLKVSNVEIGYPRVILTLGGVWNG